MQGFKSYFRPHNHQGQPLPPHGPRNQQDIRSVSVSIACKYLTRTTRVQNKCAITVTKNIILLHIDKQSQPSNDKQSSNLPADAKGTTAEVNTN